MATATTVTHSHARIVGLPVPDRKWSPGQLPHDAHVRVRARLIPGRTAGLVSSGDPLPRFPDGVTTAPVPVPSRHAVAEEMREHPNSASHPVIRSSQGRRRANWPVYSRSEDLQSSTRVVRGPRTSDPPRGVKRGERTPSHGHNPLFYQLLT